MKILNKRFHSHTQKFQHWWFNLSSREQWYVSIMSLVVGLTIIYYGIISPVNNTIASLQQAVNYQQSVIQDIQPRIAEIQRLKNSTSSNSVVSSNNLLAIVDQDLKQKGLSTLSGEVSQTGDDGVQINFDHVPFDQLTNWLIELWQQYRIQVTRIDISPAETTGDVKVVLILKASHS